MMADGVRVLVYAGDRDLICNWLGNRRWVDALEWEGSAAWAGAADRVWEVQGEAAGEVRAAGPLSFVRMYKAGHMVGGWRWEGEGGNGVWWVWVCMDAHVVLGRGCA